MECGPESLSDLKSKILLPVYPPTSHIATWIKYRENLKYCTTASPVNLSLRGMTHLPTWKLHLYLTGPGLNHVIILMAVHLLCSPFFISHLSKLCPETDG
ncbi:hypothetical protein CRENBAI_026593 [Crenichthys baileyi]|uniref:Uncharacterized protein n=1 Tax=Crenichthys baileyi TaxID=28760 RepID=A0AAV9RVX3_9TELE